MSPSQIKSQGLLNDEQFVTLSIKYYEKLEKDFNYCNEKMISIYKEFFACNPGKSNNDIGKCITNNLKAYRRSLSEIKENKENNVWKRNDKSGIW